MRHRIFIAINLPEDIKRKFGEYQNKIEELFTPYRTEGSGSGPIRWTKKENLHITLIFLGYVRDEELLEIFKMIKETASQNQPFLINLKKICYGPTNKKPPRMIWAEGEKSMELGKIQKGLEGYFQGKISGFEEENRPYTPHITLGRIKLWEFRAMEPEQRPEISEEISLSFEVKSIEIMESKLKPKGPDYFILESLALGSK